MNTCHGSEQQVTSLGCFSLSVVPCCANTTGSGNGSGNGNFGNIDIDYNKEVVLPCTLHGKQVYGQLINYGAMSTGGKTILSKAHGIENIDWVQLNKRYSFIIKKDEENTHSIMLSPVAGLSSYWEVFVSPTHISTRANINRSDHNLTAFLLYTKKEIA